MDVSIFTGWKYKYWLDKQNWSLIADHCGQELSTGQTNRCGCGEEVLTTNKN